MVRCRNPRLEETTKCTTHGSGARQVKEAAERKTLVKKAEQEIGKRGLRRTITPTPAIQEALERTAASVDYWADRARPDTDEPLDDDAAKMAAAAEARYEQIVLDLANVGRLGTQVGIEERVTRLKEEERTFVLELFEVMLQLKQVAYTAQELPILMATGIQQLTTKAQRAIER